MLRLNGRHLWNPSNFGVSAVLFLAPATVSLLSIQWGNDVWPMAVIWLLGSVIVWRVGRLHISRDLRRVVPALLVRAQRGHRHAVAGQRRADHRADVSALHLLHGHRPEDDGAADAGASASSSFVVAFVEMLLRLNEVVYAPFYALFLVGPAALLIEMWLQKARNSKPPR